MKNHSLKLQSWRFLYSLRHLKTRTVCSIFNDNVYAFSYQLCDALYTLVKLPLCALYNVPPQKKRKWYTNHVHLSLQTSSSVLVILVWMAGCVRNISTTIHVSVHPELLDTTAMVNIHTLKHSSHVERWLRWYKMIGMVCLFVTLFNGGLIRLVWVNLL